MTQEKKIYSLFPGRWQPFHEGHMALIEQVLKEGRNVCIAIRDTPITPTDPLTVEERVSLIRMHYRGTKYEDQVAVCVIPDIEEVIYGRKVGWGIRELHLDPEKESISATKIRKVVGIDELKKMVVHPPKCIWLTGLSGSGKTTIAKALCQKLDSYGYRTFHLDGDTLRGGLSRDLGFSEKDRDENIRRAGHIAKIMSDTGAIVVASFISPMERQREAVRGLFGPGEFNLVYVKCPIEVCERRDAKGLYTKARVGVIPEFTGVSAPYEEPKYPALVVETDKMTPDECVNVIIQRFSL